jgi:hypothetical protein
VRNGKRDGSNNAEEMMRKAAILSALATVLLLWNETPGAAEGGTAPEAQAMLDKAIYELKQNEAAALVKFTRMDSGMVDRDLYVLCFNMTTGKFTAHINPALMGRDIRTITEKDGSPLGAKIYDAAKAVQETEMTTISYKFPKPGSTAAVSKEMYVTRVGNQGCGISYYK